MPTPPSATDLAGFLYAIAVEQELNRRLSAVLIEQSGDEAPSRPDPTSGAERKLLADIDATADDRAALKPAPGSVSLRELLSQPSTFHPEEAWREAVTLEIAGLGTSISLHAETVNELVYRAAGAGESWTKSITPLTEFGATADYYSASAVDRLLQLEALGVQPAIRAELKAPTL